MPQSKFNYFLLIFSIGTSYNEIPPHHVKRSSLKKIMKMLEKTGSGWATDSECPKMMLSDKLTGPAAYHRRNYDHDHCALGKRSISLANHQLPVMWYSQPKLMDWLLLEGQHHEQLHQQEPHKKRRRLQGTSKSVKISNELDVREYRYPDDEIQNSWYSSGDYKRFVQDCREVLRRADECRSKLQMLSPSCHDEASCCVRGLEDQLVPRINRLKHKRKKGLIDMVVRQHVIDKMIGTSDACCSIRSISTSFSSDSKRRALELAAYDEAFVRESMTSR
jgi:hypothetical protein